MLIHLTHNFPTIKKTKYTYIIIHFIHNNFSRVYPFTFLNTPRKQNNHNEILLILFIALNYRINMFHIDYSIYLYNYLNILEKYIKICLVL